MERFEITKTEFLAQYRLSEHIDWYALLWYLAQYITIIDYDADSITMPRDCMRNVRYHLRYYDDEMASHNFSVDKTNTLWQDHHRGCSRNYRILERLANE